MVDRADYLDGEGRVKLCFTIHMDRHLVRMNGVFTKYELKQATALTSSRPIRLYELIQQFKKTGLLIVSVDEFRKMFELGQAHDRYSNIKSKIIEPAIQELRDKIGLEIKLRTEKKGRTISRLIFTFKKILRDSDLDNSPVNNSRFFSFIV
ncbi:RepB family plasmid replication initiator protein [Pseudomonas sp. L-22-4S-12]|uniref:replication initiation protein n=1 Tax=Pseudomonas sp. L-22-4S-12 TaxID=2610893 RepID=UPI00132A6D17|nr:replication initiation protein [Pseudomonas sp. L-22-4S-12]MWV17056.1 RepB family plasmid replication initiator protein [Pseudomonas sp. L-22-4S-12]